MPGFGRDKDEVLQTVRRTDGTEVNRRSVGNAGKSDLKQLAEPDYIARIDDRLRGVVPAMLRIAVELKPVIRKTHDRRKYQNGEHHR